MVETIVIADLGIFFFVLILISIYYTDKCKELETNTKMCKELETTFQLIAKVTQN